MILTELVSNLLDISDKRGQSKLNPISFVLGPVNGQTYMVVVSMTEPSHIGIPYNVTWISSDPSAPHYRKTFRRLTIAPSVGFRDTWTELTTIEQIYDTPQFYDHNNTVLLGEVDGSFATQPSSTTVRGKVLLNIPHPSSLVVEANDPRMSDQRQPTAHTHPYVPEFALVAGPTSYVRVDQSVQPTPGMMLFVEEHSATIPDLWIGRWRRPRVQDVQFTTPVILNVQILGTDSVNSGTSTPYTLRAFYSDGQQLDRTLDATWDLTVNDQPTLVALTDANPAMLIVQEFPETVNSATCRIRARLIDPVNSVEHQDLYDINVTLNPNSVPVSLSIFGPNTVNEGTSATYTVRLNYASGNSVDITPDTFTSSNPQAGTFNNGLLVAATDITNSISTTLNAQHTERGTTVSGNKIVQIVDSVLRPVSCAIVGNSSMNEGTNQQLVLNVTFDNGTTSPRTVNTWTLDPTSVATITAGGLLTANAVNANTSITARASFTDQSVTVNAMFNVTVEDQPLTLQSVSIQGPDTVMEGTTAQYSATAHYSDGSTQSVTTQGTWSLQDSSIASIGSATGLYSAGLVTSNMPNQVRFSYTNVQTVNSTKNITQADLPALARWGYGPYGGRTFEFVDQYCINIMPNNNDGNLININVPANNFAYFAHPSTLGTAQFVDTSSNFEGGWDGADWPPNDIGSTVGPITYLVPTANGTEEWKLYRTDFDGIGAFTFRVDYL